MHQILAELNNEKKKLTPEQKIHLFRGERPSHPPSSTTTKDILDVYP